MTDFQLDQTGQQIQNNLTFVAENKETLGKIEEGGFGYSEAGSGNYITWDGNITGRDAIIFENSNANSTSLSLHKVSDLTPIISDLTGAVVEGTDDWYLFESPMTFSDYVTASGGSITTGDGSKIILGIVDDMPGAFICTAPQDIVATVDESTLSFTVPSTGIYMGYLSSSNYWKTLQYGKQIVWDGDTTGKGEPIILANYGTFYKISDQHVDSISQLSNAIMIIKGESGSEEYTDIVSAEVLTFTDYVAGIGGSISSGDGTKVFVDSYARFAIAAEDQTIVFTAMGGSFTITFTAGTYFFYDEEEDEKYYLADLNYIIPTVYHQIDSNYVPAKLPECSTAGTALVYNGSEWAQQDGYGYETIIAEWDGDTSGLTRLWLDNSNTVYKVSDSYYTGTSLLGGVVNIYWNGSEEFTITSAAITDYNSNGCMIHYMYEGEIYGAYFALVSSNGSYVYNNITVPVGTWFRYGNWYTSKLGIINKIDDKYISVSLDFLTDSEIETIWNNAI